MTTSRVERLKDSLKQWADDHREWIIIGVALPAGTVAGAIERAKTWFQPKSKPSDHRARVART